MNTRITTRNHQIFLLIFAGLAFLSTFTGCDENFFQSKNPEKIEYSPIETAPRLERYCMLMRLNGEGQSNNRSLEQLTEEYSPLGANSQPAPAETGNPNDQFFEKKYNFDKLDYLHKEYSENSVDEKLPPMIARFKYLHDNIPEEVTQAMIQSNIRNYSVFLTQLNGQYYAIRYFDYVGQNFGGDSVKLERNEAYAKWRALCEECQMPLNLADGEKDNDSAAISMVWELPTAEIFYQE